MENIWSYEKEFSHCKIIASYKKCYTEKYFSRALKINYIFKNINKKSSWIIIKKSLLIKKKNGLTIKYECFCPFWRFIQSSGLISDAIVKVTYVKLDLILDIDLYQFIETGMRGRAS